MQTHAVIFLLHVHGKCKWDLYCTSMHAATQYTSQYMYNVCKYMYVYDTCICNLIQTCTDAVI